MLVNIEALVNLIILSLICYRLVQLVAFDEGPFSVFQRLRIVLGAYDYDAQGIAKTNLGRMMTCPYCLGVWIALPLSLYASGIVWYAAWFAIAGLQAFLQGLSR